eukprot:403374568
MQVQCYIQVIQDNKKKDSQPPKKQKQPKGDTVIEEPHVEVQASQQEQTVDQVASQPKSDDLPMKEVEEVVNKDHQDEDQNSITDVKPIDINMKVEDTQHQEDGQNQQLEEQDQSQDQPPIENHKEVEEEKKDSDQAKTEDLEEEKKEEEKKEPAAKIYSEVDPNNFSVLINGWFTIQVHLGDITNENVDAITNAANEYLSHGAGVAGAIMRRGGYQIQKESDDWVSKHGKVPTGKAAVTGAGKMTNVKYIIHAVGPIWNRGDKEPGQLRSCIDETLMMAHKIEIESLSIPAISSGIFGFPKDLCAQILFERAEKFAMENDLSKTTVKLVRFTNFDTPTCSVFEEEFRRRYVEDSKEFKEKSNPKKNQKQNTQGAQNKGNGGQGPQNKGNGGNNVKFFGKKKF